MRTPGMTRETPDKGTTIRHSCANSPTLITLPPGTRTCLAGEAGATRQELMCPSCRQKVILHTIAGR